jgi:gliding motility-associated lipoprotein GldH
LKDKRHSRARNSNNVRKASPDSPTSNGLQAIKTGTGTTMATGIGMSLRTSSLFLLALILLVSCDEKRVFDQYKSVGDAWHKDSIVSFDLPEMDPAKTYNLFVNIRDNDKYPYNNLFLIVSMDQPDRITKVDTLEYQMTDAEGNLLGNGFSDIKESALFYKEKVKFKKGNYKVHIRQAVRETGKVGGVKELQGISEVGFRIESAQ